MLKIRLQRVGRRNDPSYRVVVVDSKTGPKSGKHIEIVGSYDARQDRVELKGERIVHWISNGAQPSPTVHNLLVSNKVIEGKKVNVLPKKSPIISEQPEEPSPAEAPAETPAEEGETPAEEAPAPAQEEEAPAEVAAEGGAEEDAKKEG